MHREKDTYLAAHTMNMAGSFGCKNDQLIRGKRNLEKWNRNLSHFNLLLRHGSQLMAFRARFVGGRPSVLCSAEVPGVGEVLVRTTPAVEDLCCFGRAGGEDCKDEGGFGSDIVARGEEGGGRTSGSKTFFCNINKQSNIRHSSSRGPRVLNLPPGTLLGWR